MRTAAEVQCYILELVREPLTATGLRPADVPPDFDLLRGGVIDSFGLIEMIVSLEERFSIDIDLEDLEADKLTVVGTLSGFIAREVEKSARRSG